LSNRMRKRTSADSPCTSPTSGAVNTPKRPNYQGVLRDEGKLGTLTRSKLSKSSAATLNSPWTTAKHKRTIQMRKQKKEKLIILSSENKENVATVTTDTANLNLIFWIDVHQRHTTQIKQLLDGLNRATEANKTTSDYWTVEIDRTNGEGTLFLGNKSKLNQFGKMCNDPTNDKYKVEKEDDLKAFWDGLVYPSVEDFIKRVNWLIGAANDNWGDEHKDKNPNQEVKKMSTKSKPKPKTSANPVKSAEQQAKLAKSKKQAEERRAEMRKKMMEMKRQKLAASN